MTDLLQTRKGIATRLGIARRQLAEAEQRYREAPQAGPERVAARLDLYKAQIFFDQEQAAARLDAAEKGKRA